MSQLASDTATAAIRPLPCRGAEAAIVDLRRRLAAIRWPDKETVVDRSQGARLAELALGRGDKHELRHYLTPR